MSRIHAQETKSNNKLIPVHLYRVGDMVQDVSKDLIKDTAFPRAKSGLVIVETDGLLAAGKLSLEPPEFGQATRDCLKKMARPFEIEDTEIDALLDSYRSYLGRLSWYEKQIAWLGIIATKQVRDAAKTVFGSLYATRTTIAQIENGSSVIPTSEFKQDLSGKMNLHRGNSSPVFIPGYVRGFFSEDEIKTVIKAMNDEDDDAVNTFFHRSALHASLICGEVVKSNDRDALYSCWPEVEDFNKEIREALKSFLKGKQIN